MAGPKRNRRSIAITGGAIVAGAALVGASALWFAGTGGAAARAHEALIGRYCLDCHNAADRAGDLSLAAANLAEVGADADLWEAVVGKLDIGMMPPLDAPQPPAGARQALVAWLEQALDSSARNHPDPGPALARRLNRAEYANAVRDLLAVEIDTTALLPPDDAAWGFDNIADTLNTSPIHVEQYLSTAGRIAALAVGDPEIGPAAQIFRFRQDASQDTPVPGMPVGTVGGGTVAVVLPLDGEYRLDISYFKSNLGALKGLELPNDIEIAVDGERVHLATIGGRADFEALMRNITEAAQAVEERSSITVPLEAGPHEIQAGFVYNGALQTSVRLEPYDRSSQDVLDVTGHPHIETLTVTGPFNPSGAGRTPSRERIFTCRPAGADAAAPGAVAAAAVEPDAAAAAADQPRACAGEILGRLARRAYRGAATAGDVEKLLEFYDAASERGGFEAGIQAAIERLLSSPAFLFRIETDPANVAPGTVYALPDQALASRLSFFLWSSIPDDELLDLAAAGRLSDPDVLAAQVSRMLADPKSRALVDNFAGQWLYLRNLDSFVPNSVGFPNFDDNLRQSLRTETELFFDSIVREDRGVVDLMTADYTYINERVAKHYGLPGIYGSHFRRVELEDEARWGLLGKGSVLMVSSHTDRTSPVVRGKWVLENLLGAPPPAPPADVPALEDVDPEGVLSLRQRLEAHRENAVCAACHATMDPIGFALENFDAVGAWRDFEAGYGSEPIDSGARLMDGTEVAGPVELRRALLADPDRFVATVVGKLMIYALGRGLRGQDMPAVRRILSESAPDGHRFSSIVTGIVTSVPFRMRQKPGDDTGLELAVGE